jgi:hypothetical protein
MLLLCCDQRAEVRVVDLGRGGGFWTGRHLKKARPPAAAGKPLQIEIVINKNLKTQVHNSTAKLGYPQLWRENQERFLHCADRHLRRSEGERKASVCFGRNDKLAEVLTKFRRVEASTTAIFIPL